MQIFVRVPSGRTITLDVEREDSVSFLRNKIEAKEGLLSDLQRLVFAGRQLEDTQTLAEASIGKEDTVHAVLRLLGGRGHGLVGVGAFDLEPIDVSAHCRAAGGAAGGSPATSRPRDLSETDEVNVDNVFSGFSGESIESLFTRPLQWADSDSTWGDMGLDSADFFSFSSKGQEDDSDDTGNEALSSTATPELYPAEEPPAVEPMVLDAPAPVAPAPKPAPRATRAVRAAVKAEPKSKTFVEPANAKLIQKSNKGLSYNLDEVDDKLRKRLLKNRLSAERSRQRKNAERKQMEEAISKNDEETAALHKEIQRLRALLEEHKIAY